MIKWKRLEAGEYESDDKRFSIIKTWNRVYGDHWQLRDRNEGDYYKSLYREQTLLDCKLKAEALLNGQSPKQCPNCKGEKEGTMIKWKRLEAGEYESDDERFSIIKTWNRIYGNHWQLRDRNEGDYYKSLYHEQTLLDCKLKAEALANAK